MSRPPAPPTAAAADEEAAHAATPQRLDDPAAPLTDPAAAAEAELLRIYLASRDVECPQCKYNLRDLTGTRCPECGEELILRVQPVEPRQAAPLAGLVILSAGAGLNVLLLVFMAIEITRRPSGGGWGEFAAVNITEGAVMSVCVVAWLWCWRRIRRLDAWHRWLLVVGCGALTLADLIFFSKLIR